MTYVIGNMISNGSISEQHSIVISRTCSSSSSRLQLCHGFVDVVDECDTSVVVVGTYEQVMNRTTTNYQQLAADRQTRTHVVSHRISMNIRQ